MRDVSEPLQIELILTIEQMITLICIFIVYSFDLTQLHPTLSLRTLYVGRQKACYFCLAAIYGQQCIHVLGTLPDIRHLASEKVLTEALSFVSVKLLT